MAKRKTSTAKRKPTAGTTKAKSLSAGATRRRAYEYDHHYGLNRIGATSPKSKS